ncbi:MAG: hypothetical protein MZU91_02425 [Desulfosudis oleivorans]|nr:hypothetical protein [Desulfosudis oleivorans]
MPAVSTKNLFLCDKKARRFFLAVTACEKTVKLDVLAEQVGIPYLRFASEENLHTPVGCDARLGDDDGTGKRRWARG